MATRERKGKINDHKYLAFTNRMNFLFLSSSMLPPNLFIPPSPFGPLHTDKRQLYDDDEQQRWTQFQPNQPNLQSSTSDKHKPNDENWKSNEFLCVTRASCGKCQKSEKHKRENPQTEDENGWGNCLHLFSLLNFHFIYIYISTSHTHVCSVEWSERVKGKSL